MVQGILFLHEEGLILSNLSCNKIYISKKGNLKLDYFWIMQNESDFDIDKVGGSVCYSAPELYTDN